MNQAAVRGMRKMWEGVSKPITLEAAMASPSVHNLTKDILRAAEQKDALDAYRDVQLAADILKVRFDASVGR